MVSLMEKICFLILFVNLLSFAIGNQDNKAKEDDPGGLWFGPRLGKRSLRPLQEDRQTFLRLLEAADALKYYYDQLQHYDQQADDEPKVTKKVIFTPKLGRSLSRDSGYESVDFTPRLGRRLTEDMPATPADRDLQGPEQIDSRIKYYTPRLGRNMNFSPRLGRELSFEVYPEKIRVVRSTNKTKAT